MLPMLITEDFLEADDGDISRLAVRLEVPADSFCPVSLEPLSPDFRILSFSVILLLESDLSIAELNQLM